MFEECETRKCNLVFWVSFVAYFDCLSVSITFSIRLCTCEHFEQNDVFAFCSNISCSEMTGMHNLFFLICKLLLRPCDLSHRVERQKLIVISREELSVRVQNSRFMANLLLHANVHSNVLFETL